MKRILYYLVYGFLWLITLLPLRVLYVLSDFIYVILYYFTGYRRKVVYQNLRNALPDKSPAEIKQIARKFYRWLCDYFVESVYRIHMKEKENERRFQFINPELPRTFTGQGRGLILLLCHYGNYEWPTRLPILLDQDLLIVYKSLNNKYFDNLFYSLRCQFGALAAPMESSLRVLVDFQKKKRPVSLYTLADQRPQWTGIQHWTTFLNQDTPVITGPEKIAAKFNSPVLFLDIDRIERGYYRAEFRMVCEDPSAVPEFYITRKYFAIVEKKIREKPELWLWSHKRWKYFRHEARDPVYIGDITNS